MFDFITNSPLLKVITISDWISRYIILLGLLALSIISIAIIIFKALSFSFQRKKNNNLLVKIQSIQTLSDLAILSREFSDCSGGEFLLRALKQTKTIITSKTNNKISEYDTEQMTSLLQQKIDNILIEEEKLLTFLGVCSTVSPLIGLFGTIWGLIQAFINISQEKSADITIVAPGIAAALLTTLLGLIVAIPATVSSHFFVNELRKMEAQLSTLSEIYLIILKKNV